MVIYMIDIYLFLEKNRLQQPFNISNFRNILSFKLAFAKKNPQNFVFGFNSNSSKVSNNNPSLNRIMEKCWSHSQCVATKIELAKVWLERSHPRNHSIRDGCASISREEPRTEWRQGLLIRPVGKWSERNRSSVVRAMHFYCIIEVDIRWNVVSVVASSSVHGILKRCKLHLLAIVVGYALPRDRKEFFSLPSSNLAPWFWWIVTEVLIFARLE